MAQYQAFVSTLAGRYKGKGIAWQIENEPNAKAMWDGTREEYVALLKAGYAAAHQGDPGAVVLPAGLACGFSQLGYADVKFERIRGWFDAILDSKSYDAVDVHDYYPPQGGNAWGITFEEYLLKHKGWMKAKGVSVPMWMSEVGVSSQPVSVGREKIDFTDQQQASDLEKIYGIASQNGVAHAFWLKLVDIPESNVFSYMGLTTQARARKPSWDTYRRLATGK